MKQSQSFKTRYFIYPWKAGSRSARALADALGGKVLKTEGSSFVPRENRKVINWGSSGCPWSCLNSPQAVSRVSNKLLAFQAWAQTDTVTIPRFTTSRAEAQSWLTGKNKIVARTVLTGHSGQGVVISDSPDSVPEAPLYVEYVPKDREYRVHVFNGEVIDVQRKIRDPEREPTDWQVRSHQNGFVFTRSSPDGSLYRDTVSEAIKQNAVAAVASSGLVFSGVDVIENFKREKNYILECNSAVGMEGSTVDIYANAIRRYYEGT